MPIVSLNGEPFNIRIDGPNDAPALLLSNSLSSDLSMWDDQIPLWSQHFRVVRYDQRGHGQSVVSPAAYTMDQLGGDALAVLDHLGIERAHFCGLSMGGMVGMWLLTHARERLGKTVLANTSAYMGPRSLWDGRIELARTGGMDVTVEPTVTRWFPQEFHQRAPASIDRMRAMIRRVPLEGYIGSCAAIREMDQRAAIRGVDAPVMIIVGAKDPATTPEAGELIHAAIKGSTTTYLDAAHISCVEQSAAFAQAVLDTLLAG